MDVHSDGYLLLQYSKQKSFVVFEPLCIRICTQPLNGKAHTWNVAQSRFKDRKTSKRIVQMQDYTMFDGKSLRTRKLGDQRGAVKFITDREIKLRFVIGTYNT